jgi:hypothetical protein
MRRTQTRKSIVQFGSQKATIDLIPVESITLNQQAPKGARSSVIKIKSQAQIALANVGVEMNETSSGAVNYISLRTDYDSEYDRYGFLMTEDPSSSQSFHKSKQIESKELKARYEKELERSKKWQAMLDVMDGKTGALTTDTKLRERIRKGIPNDQRARAWYHLSGASKWEALYPDPSSALSDFSAMSHRTRDEIDRDIDRTYPKHIIFAEPDSGGDRSGSIALRNILHWYAQLDQEVGYCQGMGFLAGLFVIYLGEKRAFYVFCACMQNIRERPQLRTL